MAKTKSGRKELQKLFGDPTTEYSELISISPAYRASEITIPVLIVHGSEDRRVDVEHAYRLKSMLEANGKRYSWSLMEGVGHSPTNYQWLEVARTLTLYVDDFLNPFTLDFDEHSDNGP